MKTKALVARTKGRNSYNAIVFDKPETIDRLRGCEFSWIFLFGPFCEEEMKVILPCVDGDKRKIVQVS